MSEQPPVPSEQSAQTAPLAGQPAAPALPVQAAEAQRQPGLQERATVIADEKPEVAAGAAFAAGFVFAMILRRLAS
ncbi:MAG TPA: hypothetical protein VGL78_07290 [Solirubrobacteraceae bacterium]